HQIIVDPKSKTHLLEARHPRQHSTDVGRRAIESDHAVMVQILHAPRYAFAVEVSTVGVQPERDGPQPLDPKGFLLWRARTHRDARVTTQEVLDDVRWHQLDLQRRMFRTQSRQNGW